MDRSHLIAASTLLLISLCSAYYLLGILVPEGRRVSSFQIAAPGSDLQRALLASREAVLHHRDPYSDAVTRDILKELDGGLAPTAPPASASASSWDSDQQRFNYPLFTSFLLLPALPIPFAVLKPLATLTLAGLVVASVLLWADALGLSLHSGTDVLWAGLLIVWLPVIQGVSHQQLGLLAYFLVAAGAHLVTKQKLTLAGVVLALAMIKPYMALPAAVWLAFWVCGDWRRRYKLSVAFLGTIGALMAGAQLLQPGWVREWLGVAQHFRWYTQSRSPIEMLAGNTLYAALITLALWALVAWFSFRLRKSDAGSPGFSAGICLAIAAGVISSPNWLFHNQVMLLPVGLWLLVWAKKSFTGPQRLLPMTAQMVLVWYAASVVPIVCARLGGFHSDSEMLLGLPFLSIFLAPPVFLAAALRSAMSLSRNPGPLPAEV